MYTELHARSAFSFLEGASTPEDLACVCHLYGINSMALLDRDGVYGAPRFHLAAAAIGIRAHIGAEVTSTKGWRYVLLADSREGYQNLCRLITRIKLRAPKGEAHAEVKDVCELHRGLICLTGGAEGPLAHALACGGVAQGLECVRELYELFGRENVYVELQRHFCREEEARNQAAVKIARKLKLPLLATNGVCYATPREREVLDVFRCLYHHRTLATAGRLLNINAERHLKTPTDMLRLFCDLPEAIANTQILADRLKFTLDDLGYQFPDYPVPEGKSQMQFLRDRVAEGVARRYPDNEPAKKQIERELALIEKLNLAGYFLIVWDIVRYCREKNILVQGRGSAANSAVCFALGITSVDSVKMDLLFERFLSEERGEWPDIDLDLPSGEEREQAIQYIYKRYGELGAAMTANVISYRGKSAAREIGKVLSFDEETLGRLASLVGTWAYKDEYDTLDRHFRDVGLDLKNKRIRKFFELCKAVQDLPRHLGQHPGGMVICQGQLDSVVPLEPATMPGRVVAQWDKEDCADMKIVKVDLLGLGMMAVLRDTMQIVRSAYGEEIDLGNLPKKDESVYAALQKADTIGMFQIESRAQMSCLPRMKPDCFYDIVVEVAIVRPGPIVGNMMHPYLKRRQGREKPECLHPSLEPVLKRTLGVPLFQEQLLRMAMIAAGFTGGEAEELRRAFGFKRSEKRMKNVEVKLRQGMEAKGITEEAQDKIVQSITSFALYGFPESHAASFALLAYASAYFKCHYLAAFMMATLNNQPMGFYSPAVLVKDAQRHGLKFKPIDARRSDWQCTLERTEQGFVVRIGMRYVRGLRKETADRIVQERKIQEFASIDELKRRIPEIQKAELRVLAEIGALNFLSDKSSVHRRDALWQVEKAVRRTGPLLETADINGESNVSSVSGTSVGIRQPSEIRVSPLPQMNTEERLVADFRGTGMTVGPHPMAYHRERLRKQRIRTAIELTKLADGTSVRVAGAVIARQRPGTGKGFVFLSLEDETGIANIIITPQLFDQDRTVVVHNPYLLIQGKLQNQDNVISVKADRVEALPVTQAELSSHDFH